VTDDDDDLVVGIRMAVLLYESGWLSYSYMLSRASPRSKDIHWAVL